MRRGLVAFGALTLVGLGLTGCGLFRFEQREPWRAQAEEACLSQRLVQPSAYMSRSSTIAGPGACGVDYPFKVAAFSAGTVGLAKQVTLACPIIPRIETWLDEVVKPAASLYFGAAVVDLRAGSYSCRPQNSRAGAKLSEHSFGNALDIMAFVLSDGREITVVKGWRGTSAEQDFLREVFVGACRYFSTVLGPGSDAFHYDHLHIDLARHDPRGDRRICKPILNFASRLDGFEPALRQTAQRTARVADLGFAEQRPGFPASPPRETEFARTPGPAPAAATPPSRVYLRDLPAGRRPHPRASPRRPSRPHRDGTSRPRRSIPSPIGHRSTTALLWPHSHPSS
jgi:Extensin-like protein C-terminus